MLTNTAKKIDYRVRMLPLEKQEEVLRFIEEMQPTRSLLEIAQDIARNIPQKELEKLPTDGAQNIDHYLYGSPKK